MKTNTPGADAVRQLDSTKEFAVSPIYLAGEDRSAGAHVVLPLKDDFGWSIRHLPIGNVILDSPCRQTRIGYLPTYSVYRHLWMINTARGPMHPSHWWASFSAGTPSEIVAALTAQLSLDLAGGRQQAVLGTADSELVLSPLRNAGWIESPSNVSTDAAPRLVSPDGLAAVERSIGIPKLGEVGHGARSEWRLTGGVPDASWSATFTAEVPSHLLAIVARRIASASPVFRDERELVAEHLDHLRAAPNDSSARRQRNR